MLTLIITLMSTLGATGLGSAFKMFAGLIASFGDAKNKHADRDLIRDMERTKLSAKVQLAIFGGDSEASKYSRVTRRLLALIASGTFAVCMLIFAIWPSVPLITWAAGGGAGAVWSLGWGLITIPTVAAGATVIITTGHLLLVGFAMIGMAWGFYFTPAYSK